jgi:hypothetical protein
MKRIDDACRRVYYWSDLVEEFISIQFFLVDSSYFNQNIFYNDSDV